MKNSGTLSQKNEFRFFYSVAPFILFFRCFSLPLFYSLASVSFPLFYAVSLKRVTGEMGKKERGEKTGEYIYHVAAKK